MSRIEGIFFNLSSELFVLFERILKGPIVFFFFFEIWLQIHFWVPKYGDYIFFLETKSLKRTIGLFKILQKITKSEDKRR